LKEKKKKISGREGGEFGRAMAQKKTVKLTPYERRSWTKKAVEATDDNKEAKKKIKKMPRRKSTTVLRGVLPF